MDKALDQINEYLYYMKNHVAKFKETNDPDLLFFYNQQFYVICELLTNMLEGCSGEVWGDYFIEYGMLCAEMDLACKINESTVRDNTEARADYCRRKLGELILAYSKSIADNVSDGTSYIQKGQIEYYIEILKENETTRSEGFEYEKTFKNIECNKEVEESSCADGIPMSDSGSRDYNLDIKWYELAAGRGNIDAMMVLYDAYNKGIGVQRDQKIAKSWLKRAEDERIKNQDVNDVDTYKVAEIDALKKRLKELMGESDSNQIIQEDESNSRTIKFIEQLKEEKRNIEKSNDVIEDYKEPLLMAEYEVVNSSTNHGEINNLKGEDSDKTETDEGTDKFYAIYKKDEGFQKLLDEEHRKIFSNHESVPTVESVLEKKPQGKAAVVENEKNHHFNEQKRQKKATEGKKNLHNSGYKGKLIKITAITAVFIVVGIALKVAMPEILRDKLDGEWYRIEEPNSIDVLLLQKGGKFIYKNKYAGEWSLEKEDLLLAPSTNLIDAMHWTVGEYDGEICLVDENGYEYVNGYEAALNANEQVRNDWYEFAEKDVLGEWNITGGIYTWDSDKLLGKLNIKPDGTYSMSFKRDGKTHKEKGNWTVNREISHLDVDRGKLVFSLDSVVVSGDYNDDSLFEGAYIGQTGKEKYYLSIMGDLDVER